MTRGLFSGKFTEPIAVQPQVHQTLNIMLMPIVLMRLCSYIVHKAEVGKVLKKRVGYDGLIKGNSPSVKENITFSKI